MARLDHAAWRLARDEFKASELVPRLAREAAELGATLPLARREHLLARLDALGATIEEASTRLRERANQAALGRRAVHGYAVELRVVQPPRRLRARA